VSTSRQYRSSLREERALETRLRIRKSARKLFAAKGLAETTINEIAEGAGVAPQTVYSVFGTKGGIVAAILEDLQEAAGESTRIAEIVSEEDSQRQMRLFVSWIRTFFEQGAPVIRMVLTAQNDPDVAAVADRGDQGRRDGTTRLAGMWATKGDLRDGIEHEDAAQRLWLLTSAEQYILATDKLGWSPDQYEQWLGDLLERELLKRQ
jgi:AcrR family transcriptional regulator